MPERRNGLLGSWLAILCVSALLLLESWPAGRVLLPLAPDDFPAWQADWPPQARTPHPHPNWCMSDVLHLLIPGLEVNRESFSRGRLPRWDASQALGLPHIDEVHYSVFYPPAWIPLWLGLQGLGLLAWLHLVLAGGGCLLYLRALGRSSWAALIGALAFALSAWITARLQSFPVVGAAVWLPWILWGLERGGRRGLLVAALSVAASMFAGFPQVTIWVLSLSGGLELVRALRSRLRREPALPRFGRAVLALSLGLLLSAPQLLPTMHFLTTQSARGEQNLEQITHQALELPMLAHLVAPDYYATAGVPGYQPLGLGVIDQALTPPALNRAEVALGIGTLGLMLALLGLLFGRGWVERCFAATLLLLLLLLLWPGALRLATSVFPPLRLGNPKRVLLLCTLALSVLAASGVDLLRRRRPRHAVAGAAFALGLALVSTLLLLKVPEAGTEQAVRAWAGSLIDQFGVTDATVDAVLGLVPVADFQSAAAAARRSASIALVFSLLAAVLMLSLWWRGRSRPAGWLGPLLGAFLAAELLLSAYPLLRALPVKSVVAAGSTSTALDGLRAPELVQAIHAIHAIRANGASRTAASAPGGPPPRIGRLFNQPSDLRPNFPGLFGLQDLQAYAPMLSLRMVELLDAISPGMSLSGSALGGFLDPSRLSLPAVDLLGLNLLLSRQPETPPGFVAAGQVGSIRLLWNTEALPRAWHVRRAERIDDSRERLRRITSPEFEPSALAFLEEPLPEIVSAHPLDPVGPRPVRVQKYAPGDLELELGSGPAGLVVISESWHPGWRAWIDGRETGLQRADHALLGVWVEAGGPQRIHLQFRPTMHTLGMAVGALALVLLALWAAVFRP